MKARVTVTLKSGILDPQGKAIEGALRSLGIEGVASVRQGKVFDIEIAGRDRKRAQAALEQRHDFPVVASTQAAFWAALRLVGESGRVAGRGRLLEQSTAAPVH